MIDINTVTEVLREWSFWDRPVPKSIGRHPLGLPQNIPNDLVINVQGVRRSGKSTFLTQMIDLMHLDPKACFFVNFEDPRLSDGLDTSLLETIHQFALTKVPKAKPIYLFLDEVQNVIEWEKWLRMRISLPGRAHFVITGSNASLLSGELGTVLTGRHLTIEIFPFDFQEYKRAGKQPTLESYLREGGFPRTLSFENGPQLLREYFADIIEKDVRRHVAARSTTTLQQLAKAIFEAAGSELSQRKLAINMGVTTDTVGTYIDAFQTAYLILCCPFFTFSERQRQSRNRKFYPVDTGLKNAIVTKAGRDLGKDFETVVFHHLKKIHRQVYYWRGKGEVDFVVQTDNGILPIQVSYGDIQDRHHLAIESFKQEYPQSLPAQFVTPKTFEKFMAVL